MTPSVIGPRRLLAGAALLALTLATTVACSSGSSTTSATQQTLVVGSDLTYPPYAYTENGKPVGFDPEITALLGKQMNMRVQFKDTRFEQLIPGLKAGQFQLIASALYITAERAEQVDYIPYFSTGNSIVVKKGSPPLATATDLCGHRVAVIKGGAIVQQLRDTVSKACTAAGRKAVDVREFTTDPEGTQAMLSGQVDAQVTDAGVASTLSRKTSGAVTITSTELLFPVQVGLAVKKGDTALASKVRSALDAIKQNGSYAALLKTYNLSEPQPTSAPSQGS